MSTSNSETLKLYKNDKLYNGSRYMVYLRNRTMESFLGTPDYSKTVYYKSISEPITIDESIRYCDEYTYGSITNDGKTYYFFVDSISTDAFKQTTINYTIDWWATNWAKINCTKAHVTRKPTKPGYMPQPWTPLNTSVELDSLTDDFLIAATYIPSKGTSESQEESPSYISYVLLEGNSANLQKVSQGTWYKQLGIAGSDIKDCFIVPFFTLQDLMGDEELPPMFMVSIDRIDDHVHNVGWFGGPIMNAWHEKYPCLDDNIQQPTDANLFTGNEILYNEYTGRWYKTEYVRWPGTPGMQDYYFWEWVEIEHSDINRYPVTRYYTK